MTRAGPLAAVLGYHKIGESPGEWESWYYVPQPLLEQHVELLRGDGWQPLAPDELVAGLDDPASLPQRSFLVTFDDAYRSLSAEAVPWLVANDVPAVVFVPTAYVGGLNDFDRDIEPEEPIYSWDELRALKARGIWIESHGATHRAFSELTQAALAQELKSSKAELEKATGAAVNLISYPYGDPGRDPTRTRAQLQAAGYRAAFDYGGGLIAFPGADRFRLPRIAMGPDTELRAEIDRR